MGEWHIDDFPVGMYVTFCGLDAAPWLQFDLEKICPRIIGRWGVRMVPKLGRSEGGWVGPKLGGWVSSKIPPSYKRDLVPGGWVFSQVDGSKALDPTPLKL